VSWVLGKLVWTLLRPSTFLLVLAAAGLLFAWRGRRGGLVLASVAIGLMALATLLPLGLWLGRPLETRFPQPLPLPERVDGIVVLGGGTEPHLFVGNGRPDFDEAGDRYLAMLELARRFPRAKVLFTGGVGRIEGQPVTEAEVVAALWDRHGLPPERLLLERESRNTFENARNSAAVARPGPGVVWVVGSTAKHMPRSVGCFRAVGFPVVPFPVDYRAARAFELKGDLRMADRLWDLDEAAYEWYGLLYYRLLGHIDTLLPGPTE
jgi:uncharacterized SAM-binding protein YcdF (DUF218 family)